jgi:hypothetical protein
MSETSFDQVITEHLTLSRRNKRLERTMPLDRYREQREGASADEPLVREAESPGDEEPATQPNASLRADPESWWETEDGECPPPPLGWDGAD